MKVSTLGHGFESRIGNRLLQAVKSHASPIPSLVSCAPVHTHTHIEFSTINTLTIIIKERGGGLIDPENRFLAILATKNRF